MLEHYFQPRTVDRFMASWIGPAIEEYVGWLARQGYARRVVLRRVPMLMHFGEYARVRGARALAELPPLADTFVSRWIKSHAQRCRSKRALKVVRAEARAPVYQMLRVMLPEFAVLEQRAGQSKPWPFEGRVAGFPEYLTRERGLSHETIRQYGFLRYLHREGVCQRDLSRIVDWPRSYRLAEIPRSITMDEVQRVLSGVDRRTPVGKRDYAMMLLLVTYGLRAREVAALTFDDLDWEHDRLRVPNRKAGHSTVLPLSSTVGAALVDYIRRGRAHSTERLVFLHVVPPFRPVGCHDVSSRATFALRRAGVGARRPGSHTFRHTCVQRLVDARFPLEVIGDYVGHRSPNSTRIYGKVDIDSLREVAMGDGEEVL